MSATNTALLLLLGVLGSPAPADPGYVDYLPLSAEEIGPRFPLKHVGTVDAKPAILASGAGPVGSSFKVADGRLTLAGLDKHRKHWQVDLLALDCSLKTEVFEGDLDRDGVMDAIVYRPTCGVGLAPQEHVVAITFDASGRPVPFEAEGYSGSGESGIDALVDLDRSGQADLIFMNFNDGYWITNVYSVHAGRWQRVAGKFANHSFPLYTRFTNSSNKKPVIPPASRHPVAPDLSDTIPYLTGTLGGWRWPNGKNISPEPSALNLTITVIGPEGKHTECSPSYWYDSARLVVDESQGRHVYHLSQADHAQIDSVLARLASQHADLLLFGRRDASRCSPELVWATIPGAARAGAAQRA